MELRKRDRTRNLIIQLRWQSTELFAGRARMLKVRFPLKSRENNTLTGFNKNCAEVATGLKNELSYHIFHQERKRKSLLVMWTIFSQIILYQNLGRIFKKNWEVVNSFWGDILGRWEYKIFFIFYKRKKFWDFQSLLMHTTLLCLFSYQPQPFANLQISILQWLKILGSPRPRI